MRAVERYAWADDPELDLTWCLSVIDGSDEATVVQVFGGDPTQGTPMTFREAEAESSEHFGQFFSAQVFAHGRHVVVIENYGYSGSVPEIARQASQGGGSFFSFHIDMNGSSTITQADDGKITAFFEPLFVNDRDLSHPWRPEWAAATNFRLGRVQAASLAALEQQTGLAVERSWLDAKLPAYRLPDPDALLKDIDNARQP